MCRCREDVPKQEGFVDSLVQYTSSQWKEFFRMSPTTAQRLVETIGPFFAERSGWFKYRFVHLFEENVWLCVTEESMWPFTGRGRTAIHLQDQILMLLHFLAHQGKYGLLSEKFGVTCSCYHGCVDSLLEICVQHLLHRFIQWPSADQQKECSDYFHERYGFPGVVGAINGTHITIAKPPGEFFPEDYFSVRKKIYTMLLQVNRNHVSHVFVLYVDVQERKCLTVIV